MAEKYQTLDLGIVFRTKMIEQSIRKIWRTFFDRVTELDFVVDRAIWICNRFPAWVGVKPGSAHDRDDEEPAFVLSAVVGGIDSIRDELRAKQLSEREYRQQIEPVYVEYYRWLRQAIKDSFESSSTSRVRSAAIAGRFGVYTTQIDDLSTTELDKMDWIAGDKLK